MGVKAVNIGMGDGRLVLDVVKAFEKDSGRTIKSQIVGRREGDRDADCVDASKAKALFGWEAKFDIDRKCPEL